MEGNSCGFYSNHCPHTIGLVISNEYTMIQLIVLITVIGIAGFAVRMWYEAIVFSIRGLIEVYRESKLDSPADNDV